MDHEDKDLDAIITINLYYHRSVQIVEILNKAFHGIGRLTIDVCSVKIIKKLSQAGLEAFWAFQEKIYNIKRSGVSYLQVLS